MTGGNQLVAVTQDGTVRGFNITEKPKDIKGKTENQDDAIEELEAYSSKLVKELQELKNVQDKCNNERSREGKASVNLPPKINLIIEYIPDFEQKSVELMMKINFGVIRCVQIIGNHLDAEISQATEQSVIVHPDNPSASLYISFRPTKDVEIELRMKILISMTVSDSNMMVLNRGCTLPKFSMYTCLRDKDAYVTPES